MTGSSMPSEKSEATKPASMVPQTMAECVALQRWVALGRDVAPPTVTKDELARHLKFLAAALPSKAIDGDAGRDRVAVYFRMLGEYTHDAIAYMSERACREHDWFPTPAQCLAILKTYRAPLPDKEVARTNCQAFLQAQMEAFHLALRADVVPQAMIDEKPDQWKRIAEEKGWLRLIDGQYVQRRQSLTQRDEAA